MPTQDAVEVKAKEEQRRAAKRATFDRLKTKKAQTEEFEVTLDGEQMSFLFKSVGTADYDKLITRCPPTMEQRAENQSFDINRFAPALLARVCSEPAMDESDWAEIWNSPEWGRGELMTLFYRAVSLCNKDIDLNPIVTG